MKTELEMIKENLLTMTLSVDGNTEYSKGYLHALEFALKQIEILIKIK